MKRLIVGLLAIAMLSSCTMMMAQHTPASMGDGSQGFFVTTTYGSVNSGSKEMATKTLERYSTAICPAGYTRLGENTNPFITAHGLAASPNGAKDLVWEIKCKNAEPSKS